MRIIAGEKKGFILKAPRGLATRPTLGHIRESLFNILRHEVPGAIVVDLYAGAGTLGLEALSQGAKECYFVERSPQALEALRHNIAKVGYEEKSKVIKASVERWLEMQKTTGWPRFSLAFSDPPYDSGAGLQSLDLIAHHLPLELSATVVIQASPREELPETSGRLRRYRTQRYGETVLHFYVCTSLE